jgi:hypothetical protein
MRTTYRSLSPTTALLLATALTVLLAAPSCGSSTETTDPPPTDAPAETTPSPPDTTTAQPEQAVLAAYERFWTTYLAATDPPDPNAPSLNEIATGLQLETTRQSLEKKQADNTATRKPPGSKYRHDAVVISFDQNSAVIRDCQIDDLLVVDLSTGTVINSDIDTILLTGYLARVDGVWKVSDIQEVKRTSGEHSCDV